MTKTKFLSYVLMIVLLVGGLTALAGQTALAADCKVLAKGIDAETNMIKKRTKIVEALKSCPDDAVINFEYGYNFERFRKYEDALKYYNKSVNSDKKFAKGYFGIGDVQKFLGNYKASIDAYELGLKFEPNDDRALKSLQEAKDKFRARGGVVDDEPKKVAVVKAPEPPPKVVAAPAPPPVPARVASVAEAPILRLQVPFDTSKDDLSLEAKDLLDVVVGQAMERSDMQDAKFEVSGHTDNSGNAGDNMELSKRRAENVKKYLVDNFRIDAGRLETVFYGQNRPKLPNTTSQNRIANQRVEFRRLD